MLLDHRPERVGQVRLQHDPGVEGRELGFVEVTERDPESGLVGASSRDYDLILAATGYKLHYPFLDHALLNWQGMALRLYLNIFAPLFDRLAVLGMVEASGLGWQGRYEQAELVARYFKAQAEGMGQDEVAHRAYVAQRLARAAQATNVDFNYLLAQAEVESSMSPNARAATSSATPPSWRSPGRTTPGSSPRSATSPRSG